MLNTRDISIPIYMPTFEASAGMTTMYALKIECPDYHLRLVGEPDEK